MLINAHSVSILLTPDSKRVGGPGEAEPSRRRDLHRCLPSRLFECDSIGFSHEVDVRLMIHLRCSGHLNMQLTLT